MDRAQLKTIWSENNDRPAVVREYRDAIHEYTDTSDPVPDGSLHDVREWLDRYKPVVTKQLRADGENTTTEDAEEVDNE